MIHASTDNRLGALPGWVYLPTAQERLLVGRWAGRVASEEVPRGSEDGLRTRALCESAALEKTNGSSLISLLVYTERARARKACCVQPDSRLQRVAQ